jgi:hypothetical protein
MSKQVGPELVIVQWVDAYHLDGWMFGSDPEIDPSPCWTVGFLSKKNRAGVLIAQTWYAGDTANMIFIPRGMIKKMTVLGDLKVDDDDGTTQT